MTALAGSCRASTSRGACGLDAGVLAGYPRSVRIPRILGQYQPEDPREKGRIGMALVTFTLIGIGAWALLSD